MKKIVTALFATALLISCSTDSDNQIDTPEDAFDIAKIEALSTMVPDASFDLSEQGLYRGIFASADVSLHGEIVVSIKSDNDVSALVMLTNEKNLYFNGKALGDSNYTFTSKEASFTLDLSDPSNVVIAGSDYNNRPINMRIVKDLHNQRAAVSLGTFQDSGDAGFGGTWDFISTSTFDITQTIPIPPFVFTVTVNAINEVVICYDNGTPGGLMFNDTMQEDYTTAGCAGIIPADTYTPFFSGAQVIDVPFVGPTAIDEYAAFGQTTTINGVDATWNFGSSIIAGTPGVQAYVDLSCMVVPSGNWSWNGRSGTVLFD
ncbi:MAG: hypothetical protein ABJM06_08420 [Gilvibacter sp.]